MAFRRDGTVAKSWRLLGMNGDQPHYTVRITVGDFNHDGKVEIALLNDVVSGGGASGWLAEGVLSVLSTGAPVDPAGDDWPMIFQNAQNTAALRRVAKSTTSVLSSANPSLFGQPVTLTVTVASTAGGGTTPSGSISLYEGGSRFTSCDVVAGTCSVKLSALSTGTHDFSFNYSGDTRFDTSRSVLSQIVNPAGTSLSLTSDSNSVVAGQNVTFTAAVSVVAPGAGTPTGTVTFNDGTNNIGSVVLDTQGQALLTTASLLPGGHSISTTYNGDSNFLSAISTTVAETVTKASTSVALMSNFNTSVEGQPVTLKATVSVVAPGAGVPTGTVTFYDGASAIESKNADASGQASLTLTTPTQGSHTFSGSYSGDVNFLNATSAQLTHTVGPADFLLNVSSAQTVNAGAAASYTISVAPNPVPYNFAVTSFSCSNLPSGAACTFSPASVTPGADPASITLTITTTARSIATLHNGTVRQRPFLGLWLSFGLTFAVGIVRLGKQKKSGIVSVAVLLSASCFLLMSCGGGGGAFNGGGGMPPSGTPAGSYNVTVTATGNGSTSHTATVSLKVN